ncbi:50S ribosomal protein L13 [Ilyobacter polytropus]|uniref:Large ribosomal subunit protein uL13 n=1 Tax=Ilyobacter polytropus (strain ATCC 51220 / DSM 2926 / LMG 16218 / CuHBu1) TaxID=572544 RepID=E3HAM8_ILYPC|nr:50S ribosomal protein L13 [uncultured Ilyobacter sp.]ADO83215.1 LSU ribosomal protein L13P [Ilyobacter polytropus DSM 2926]
MNKYTVMQRKEDVIRDWYHYDAEGKILGRLAAEIAKKLMGKNKVTYTPHIDGGDFVIVTNMEKIAVTGKKLTDKMYYNHSGFPGGLRERRLEEVLAKKPEEALMLAVKRMLPNNKLGREQLTRLRVFVGAEHTHAAQKPETVEL